jgi:hypothetical protein
MQNWRTLRVFRSSIKIRSSLAAEWQQGSIRHMNVYTTGETGQPAGASSRIIMTLEKSGPDNQLPVSPAEKARIWRFRLWIVGPSLAGLVVCVGLHYAPGAKLPMLANEALPYLTAFFTSLLVLMVFSLLVSQIIEYLHREGHPPETSAKVREIALSGSIAIVEQFLFYLAAIAGRPEVFKFAVGGWLVFKTVNKYARWEKPEEKPRWESALENYRYKAAIAHNRFQIFAIGTAMSIAAGGTAGVVYRYLLYLLKR